MAEAPLPINSPAEYRTFREIVYTEEDQVGYLSFDFYEWRDEHVPVRPATRRVSSRPLAPDPGHRSAWRRGFLSNGIDLNMIEASTNPAAKSWRNINAIDDLTFEILNTMSHLVIAGLRGAGAGGAMMALAADCVYARSGVVLNPHYRSMGDLFGSEYWTYTLPRRVGQTRALELTQSCQPIGTRAAKEWDFLTMPSAWIPKRSRPN